MPTGPNGEEKTCQGGTVHRMVSVVTATVFLTRILLGVTRVNAAKHKVARGDGCFGSKKK